jgi:hypothetical protein
LFFYEESPILRVVFPNLPPLKVSPTTNGAGIEFEMEFRRSRPPKQEHKEHSKGR